VTVGLGHAEEVLVALDACEPERRELGTWATAIVLIEEAP
jgi:hypothetical protein